MRNVVLGFLLWSSLGMSQQTAETDASALCEFYAAINNKNVLTNWCGEKGADGTYVNGPCNPKNPWTGVMCGVIAGVNRVTGIGLAGKGLGGTISSSIGNLVELSVLGLNYNGFTGTVPTSIWTLTKLVHLSLHENYLPGTIPTVIGGLTGLSYLALFTMGLSGTIPSQIGLLTNMVTLNLRLNRFIGTIPTTLGLLKQGHVFRPPPRVLMPRGG